jgi:outer membrane protein OmpA-like peptidoglycan-associated protein
LGGLLFSFAAWVQGQHAAVPYDSLVVYFSSGKSSLSTKAEQELKTVYKSWNGAEEAIVELTGHTDALGEDIDNDSLSERRVSSVRDSLIALGIPAEDVFAVAFGELKPVASNEQESGRRKNRRVDIRLYTVASKPMLSGIIRNRKTDQPLPFAEVVITTEDQTISAKTDEQGRFRVEVPEGVDMRVEVFSKGYFFKTKALKSGADKLDIPLAPAEEGAIFPFENMNFEGNLPVLVKESEKELPVLLKFMQMNPGMSIEIAGHINGIMYPIGGEPKDKFQLSVDRAKAVYDYLVNEGIDPGRIRYKGYGNRHMIYPSPYASFDEQAENRRVEIRILKVN